MPRTAIGYFVEESKPKRARGSPGFLFSGGVLVPEDNEASHFHKYLKDEVFSSKNATLSSLLSDEDLQKKSGSLLELGFNNKRGEKWEQTNPDVKHGLEHASWWTKSRLLTWVTERLAESSVKPTSSKSVSKEADAAKLVGENDSVEEESRQHPSLMTDNHQSASVSDTRDLDVPTFASEVTIASSFNISQNIDIKLGPNGPLVTVSEDALQAWKIDVEKGDQAGMYVLMELSPALVRENLKLSDTVRDLRSQVDDISRDLLSSNTSNMDMRTKLVSSNENVKELKNSVKKQEDDLKNKDEQIGKILEDIGKKVDENSTALSSTRTDILASLGRMIDTRNRPREVSWTNPWPKAIASLKITVQLYLTQETADVLHSSKAFGEDMNAMIKADLLKTNILPTGSFKEFVLAIKKAEAKGSSLFFFEHEVGCTTGDSIMDQDAVTTMKNSASRLISLTDEKYPSIFISLPCEPEDLDFAMKVEKEMKVVFETVAMNTMVKEGTVTNTPGNNLAARAFAEAVVALSSKSGVILADPCAQCKGFCQGEPCLLSADVQPVYDVEVEESSSSSLNNNQGYRISKRSPDDPQVVIPHGVNKKASGPKFCWICGSPLSNHTPAGRPCHAYNLSNCKVCDGKGHKTSAHHVMGPGAQAAMQFKWGADFEFIKFSRPLATSRRGGLKRKTADQ